MTLSATKKTVIVVVLLVLCLAAVSIGVKIVNTITNDPVFKYDVSSMPAGSHIVSFEKCGENKFCGFNDNYHIKNVEVFYKDRKVTHIDRYSAYRETGGIALSIELSPEQKVISETISTRHALIDGKDVIYPSVICKYDTKGNLISAILTETDKSFDYAQSAEQRCGTKNPNQNPEVLKILRFFNSKEGKRMLQ